MNQKAEEKNNGLSNYEINFHKMCVERKIRLIPKVFMPPINLIEKKEKKGEFYR